MKLKKLLDAGVPNVAEIEKTFDEIAKTLFQNYHIQKGYSTYEFLEIEYYYYKEGHEDIITYPRNIEAGMWLFHNSGVDITFKSKCVEPQQASALREAKKDYFGGILLRSLLKKEGDGIIICGPLNCTCELFDKFNALKSEETEYPIIKPKTEPSQEDLFKIERVIKIKEKSIKARFEKNEDSFYKYCKKPYRYFIGLDMNDPKVKQVKHTARPWTKKNYKSAEKVV